MKVDIDQLDRKAFLTWRLSGVGASDVSSIVGASPYVTREELFTEKTTGVSKPVNGFIVNRGHQIEKVARAYANLYSGLNFEPACFQDDEYPYRRASLDGYDKESRTILEAKYVGAEVFNAVNIQQDIKDVFLHYYIQIQWQLLVVDDVSLCLFCMVDSKNRKKIIEVHKDNSFIKNYDLIDAVDRFWGQVKGVTKEVVPELPPQEKREKKVKKVDDEAIEILLDRRMALSEEIKRKTEELKVVEENLKVLEPFKDKHSFMCGKHNVIYVQRKGSINYKDIPELKSVDLEKYRSKSSGYWRYS